MTGLDIAGIVVFSACWLFYEPLLKRIARRAGAINTDMTVVRLGWMRNMARRENRFIDSQLLGHALSSASFFASANLIIIAAVAGAVFGGEATYRSVSAVPLLERVPPLLFEAKLALVLIALVRGLLDFIWAIRQMNYCLAVIGAAPEAESGVDVEAYARAAAGLINPALSSFNAGVRAYYFALAAAVWLVGPIAFLVATIGAVVLLMWRQRRSPTARAVRDIRSMLEG